eukprot:m.47988 g.47988  ORF g.47988 m.47988 type:complete len:195 (-) comp20634_c0_seq1:160-744(-)
MLPTKSLSNQPSTSLSRTTAPTLSQHGQQVLQLSHKQTPDVCCTNRITNLPLRPAHQLPQPCYKQHRRHCPRQYRRSFPRAKSPSNDRSHYISFELTFNITILTPTWSPSVSLTVTPTNSLTSAALTSSPSESPTVAAPTSSPTRSPTRSPTMSPTTQHITDNNNSNLAHTVTYCFIRFTEFVTNMLDSNKFTH